MLGTACAAPGKLAFDNWLPSPALSIRLGHESAPQPPPCSWHTKRSATRSEPEQRPGKHALMMIFRNNTSSGRLSDLAECSQDSDGFLLNGTASNRQAKTQNSL